MKNKFYIFLDFDGVLYDWKYIMSKSRKENKKNSGLIKYFNPKCIDALNHLIEEQSKTYDVKLVISSTWRIMFKQAKNLLKSYNVIDAETVDRTPISRTHHKRGKEILAYLTNNNFDKTKDDFLILDNENFDFKKYFSKDKIIKTSIISNSLSMKMVEKYLSKNIKNCKKMEENEQKM